ncbi:uncharacterized protein LOC134781637 [Penaeus indicus]|uniref:uncharacterized protein LOC134781637 n=1 Tax=Penaeus indicus TaxID=29960 RepID=UPI00300C6D9A
MYCVVRDPCAVSAVMVGSGHETGKKHSVAATMFLFLRPILKASKHASIKKPGVVTEVVMREKKGGALSKVQKLKRRISHSFGKLESRERRKQSTTHTRTQTRRFLDCFPDRRNEP